MTSGNSTQTSCSGTLYDVGGPNGNYFDNNDSLNNNISNWA